MARTTLTGLWISRRRLSMAYGDFYRGLARGIIASPIVSLLSIAIFMVDRALRDEWPPQTTKVVALCCSFTLTLYAAFIFQVFLKRYRRILDRKTAVPLKDTNLANKLRASLANACELFRIPLEQITIYDESGNYAWAPHVIDTGVDQRLYVPRGFYELSEGQQKAVLAHEVGHLAQSDTDSWFFAEWSRRSLIPFILPAVAINAVASLYLVWGIPEAVYQTSVIILFQTLYVGTFVAATGVGRRFAEKSADLASVISGNGAGLESVLERVDDHDGNEWVGNSFIGSTRFGLHPSPKTRRQWIQGWNGQKVGEIDELDSAPRISRPRLVGAWCTAWGSIGIVIWFLAIGERPIAEIEALPFGSIIALVSGVMVAACYGIGVVLMLWSMLWSNKRQYLLTRARQGALWCGWSGMFSSP